jgi:hypothetical protein
VNVTLIRALVLLVPALALLLWSAAVCWRHRTVGSTLQVLGAVAFCVVVLTHLAEGLHVLAFMRWGDRGSAGHYLDLVSAGVGAILMPLGLVTRARENHRTAARP